jgi:hypothetical protein
MIETQMNIQLVIDANTAFLVHPSQSKIETDVRPLELEAKRATHSNAVKSINVTGTKAKCQGLRPQPKSTVVHWGRAYVYLSNVDPKELPKMW